MKRSVVVLMASLTLAMTACATLPTMDSVAGLEAQKNYPALIQSLGIYTDTGSDAEKAQKRAMEFILANKAEALPEVVKALSTGTGDLRSGAADVAFEWSDPAFIEPLFTALGDSSENIRQSVGYAFKKQAETVPADIREKTAMRLVEQLMKERGISVWISITSALAVYAVPATHGPLVGFEDAVFKTKSIRLNLIGGAIPRYYQILLEKNLAVAIKLTETK